MRERLDYTPLLGTFRLPSLVIGADKDLAVPLENARILLDGLPDSTGCIIPGGGHLVNLEDPKAFNTCLLDFLRRLPAGSH
jgi:pimeloyl-ACP methyl ester carboxylesterase